MPSYFDIALAVIALLIAVLVYCCVIVGARAEKRWEEMRERADRNKTRRAS